MKPQRKAGLVLLFSALLLVLCLLVFHLGLSRDLMADDMESFEIAARLIGYGLSLLCVLCCLIDAYTVIRRQHIGKMHTVALCSTCAALLLLCTHDVMLYEEYGNGLEGSFTMTAFFMLDTLLLLSYGLYIYAWFASKAALLRTALVLTSLAWIAYMIGDMAGYPMASLADWDEPVMKLGIAIAPVFSFILRGGHDKHNAG